MSQVYRIAIVTQGYRSAGGVRAVAHWVVRIAEEAGHTVDVFDISAAWNDPFGRRIFNPVTWGRRRLIRADHAIPNLFHVAGNAPEIEAARYLPRRALTARLNTYDAVQVVCGGPALACVAARTVTPVAIQVATTVAWERRELLASKRFAGRTAHRIMIGVVSRMEKVALRSSRAVLVENNRMKNHVGRVAPRVRVRLAPPGIDEARFKPNPEGWQQHGPIVTVTRLRDPRKRLDILIRAYAECRTIRPGTPRLVIAGRGRLPDSVEMLIDDLGLRTWVTILANVADADLTSVLQQASVFLQASSEEGLGIAVLEAMACGLPVVATRTAGTEESVRPGTGILVEPGADVIQQLAAGMDVALTSGGELGARAREHVVAHFSTAATASLFLETFKEIIVGPAARE